MEAPMRREIIEWEVRNWGRALDVWQPHLALAPGARALTLGERHGGLSLWLASQGWQVTATDLHGLTPEAAERFDRHGVAARITTAAADITALDFADNTFDLVAFKSVLGALSTKDRQRQAMSEIHRVLKPHGLLLFAENLRGSRIHQWMRRRFVPWSTYWRYLDMRSDQDLFAPFATWESQCHGLLGAFGRSEPQRDLLARLDGVLCPLVPSAWQYILFGVARKSAAAAPAARRSENMPAVA